MCPPCCGAGAMGNASVLPSSLYQLATLDLQVATENNLAETAFVELLESTSEPTEDHAHRL